MAWTPRQIAATMYMCRNYGNNEKDAVFEILCNFFPILPLE